MKDNTTAKEQMLKKIRKALLEKRENPYPNLEESQLYKKNTDELEVLFAEQLTAISGNFIFVKMGLILLKICLQLADKFKWRKIYCWEPELQQFLTQIRISFLPNR